ncbi:OmpA family protein [Herbidospora sp. RD11066]
MSRRLGPALATFTLVVAGCSFLDVDQWTPVPSDGPKADACASIESLGSGSAPAAEEVVIVVDRSASMRGMTTNAPPDWKKMIFGNSAEARDGGEIGFGVTAKVRSLRSPALIKIGSFDGGPGVTWQPPIALPEIGGGVDMQQWVAATLGDCLGSVFTSINDTPANSKGTNVMAAFDSVQATTDAPKRLLVVATDGLSSIDCTSVEKTAMRDLTFAAQTAASCRTGSDLPDLKGWQVEMPWVGVQGEGRQPLTARQRTWLQRLWTDMCRKTKASCTVDSAPLEAAKGSADIVEKADLEIQRMAYSEPPNPVRVAELDGDLLFTTGKYELRPEGVLAIRAFADEVLPLSPTRVHVVGHTDDVGTDLENQVLSQRRAKAVRAELQRLGFANITVAGKGETQPAIRSTSTYARSKNRRVEIKYKVIR